MSHPPDLVALSLLVAVADHGSIGRAAALAGVSQPSASVRLRRLERDLGVRLLERSHTGTTLTEAGRVVSGWSTDILTAAERLHTGVQALAARGAAVVHIAASFTIAEVLVPSWLARLRAGQEGLSATVEVTNSTGVQSLVRNRDVRLGFVEGPDVGPDLVHRLISDDELVLVATSAHPWARRGRIVTPAQLVSEPLVLREQGSGTRDALLQALRQVGAGDPLVALELGSTASVMRAVSDGAGPTVVSRLAAASSLANGSLVEIPLHGLELKRKLRAVWRSGSGLEEGERELLDIATAGR